MLRKFFIDHKKYLLVETNQSQKLSTLFRDINGYRRIERPVKIKTQCKEHGFNNYKEHSFSYIVSSLNLLTLVVRLSQGPDTYPESFTLPSPMFNSWREVETSMPKQQFNSDKGEEECVERSTSSL